MKLRKHPPPRPLPLPPQPLPWLLFRSKDEIFCTIPSFPPQKLEFYSYSIPKLYNKKIKACSNGWLILSDFKRGERDRHYSLYNPVTVEYIRLPPVPLLEYDVMTDVGLWFTDWILSSPLDDPDSTLVLFRRDHPSIVYFRLHDKKKRWKEIHYHPGRLFHRPVSCKGNIYAMKEETGELVMIETSTFKHPCKNHSITRFCGLPILSYSAYSVESCDCNGRLIRNLNCRLPIPPKRQHQYPYDRHSTYLVESCGVLFIIYSEIEAREEGVVAFFVYKLDFSSMVWEKVESARDRVFFLSSDERFAYSCSSENQVGGYIHYVTVTEDHSNLYSYNIEDKTITLSCPGPKISNRWVKPIWVMFENRLTDHREDKQMTEEAKISSINKAMVISSIRGDGKEGGNSSNNNDEEGERNVQSTDERLHLLDLSPHILELIIEQCTLVDYLNFRAVCKSRRLAAPLIQWRKLRSQTSSTPLLMSLDKDKEIMSFIDPKLGDRYFVEVPELLRDTIILSCNFGWLLLLKDERSLVFYNPFTKATVELPEVSERFLYNFNRFSSFSLSAPPDNSSCKIIVITETNAFLTSPGKSELWVSIRTGNYFPIYLGAHMSSSVFYGEDLYCLRPDGKLVVFRMALCCWESLVVEVPRHFKNRFLVKCDNDLLSVIVSCNGESVETFKLNISTMGWEKVENLGKHTIHVSHRSSFSVVAKIPGTENKIYFPRLYEGKLVFYSLDTCKFHTFGAAKGKGNEEEALMSFYGTKVHANSCWIEPNW